MSTTIKICFKFVQTDSFNENILFVRVYIFLNYFKNEKKKKKRKKMEILRLQLITFRDDVNQDFSYILTFLYIKRKN